MQTTDDTVVTAELSSFCTQRPIRLVTVFSPAYLATALLMTSCVVYEPASTYQGSTLSNGFDRSWSAAVGAMEDQGVRIKSEDRATGMVRGTRDNIDVSSVIRTQADGGVRVEFNRSGDTSQDPTLIDRISRSYDRRTGR